MQSRQDLVTLYRSLRAWEPARHQQTLGASTHSPFRVASFNILAQGHIKREQFPYCAKDTLKWSYRRDRLLAEIEAYAPDICALQEMDHYENFFKGELGKLGYETFYEQKRPDNSQSDGLCIAWNPLRFRPAAHHRLSLAPTMLQLPDATPNIAQFILFQDLAVEGRWLVVANTHLYWHWDHDGIRAVQAQFLFERLFAWMECEEVKSICNQPVDFIVCGDFNSDPTSVAYRLISRRPLIPDQFQAVMANTNLDDTQLDQLSAYFAQPDVPRVRSAYACQIVTPDVADKVYGAFGELPWTTYSGFKDPLDYIFFREESLLTVKSLLMLPDMAVVAAETALPNHTYVSDHLALVAEFSWRNEPYLEKL